MSTVPTQTTTNWHIRREDCNELGSPVDTPNNRVVMKGSTTNTADELKGRSAAELGFFSVLVEFDLSSDYYTTIYWLEIQVSDSEEWTTLCSIEPARRDPYAYIVHRHQ